MKIILAAIMISVSFGTQVYAENNTTNEALKKAIQAEEKYAKEQKFYRADEYDFKGSQVDPKSLEKIKEIEPDYDFDMDEGVYDD